MKALLCWILGHRWSWWSWNDYRGTLIRETHCARCGERNPHFFDQPK